MTSTRFRVPKKVVYEAFDDELVIINLDNGNYYTLTGAAADIWQLVEAGATLDEIEAQIAGAYMGESSLVRSGVAQLVESLVAEDLIAPDATRTPAPAPRVAAAPPRPFETPVLQKYMDMQALLLLDPIHEVDEMGWPMPRVNQP